MTTPPTYITPGDIAPPVKLSELDRSTVVSWAQRHAYNPNGRWVQIPSPEDRTSNRYKVIAQLQDGGWIAVFWGKGVGGGGPHGRGGDHGGAGRPLGVKNSKPRSDKGKKRTYQQNIQSDDLLLTPTMI